MSIITFTEIETGQLVDIDTDIVFISSLINHERGTVIHLEQIDPAGARERQEHHVRGSFSKVIDALAVAAVQQTEAETAQDLAIPPHV